MRLPPEMAEEFLNLKNVVHRGSTEELNFFVNADPVFKCPEIPERVPVLYSFLCERTKSDGELEEYSVVWISGGHHPELSTRILASSPTPMEATSQSKTDLADSMWVSRAKYPFVEQSLLPEVDSETFMAWFRCFPSYSYCINKVTAPTADIIYGNVKENVFRTVVRKRMEFYEKKFHNTRNDYWLKRAVFFHLLDKNSISTEHYALMFLFVMQKRDAALLEAILRQHY